MKAVNIDINKGQSFIIVQHDGLYNYFEIFKYAYLLFTYSLSHLGDIPLQIEDFEFLHSAELKNCCL